MRFASWLGWAAALIALFAGAIVTREFVRIHHRPASASAPILSTGATFAPVGHGDQAALVVTSLQTGGPGAAAGLQVGDRIEDVDGLPAPTIAAFNRDVARGSYDVVDLRIARHGQLIDIALRRGGAKNG